MRILDTHLCVVFLPPFLPPLSFFFFFRFYLFLERGEGREKKRERNMDVREKHWLVASYTSADQGPNLQPRHVPRPGIGLATFHFVGWCPTNWVTPVRAPRRFFLCDIVLGDLALSTQEREGRIFWSQTHPAWNPASTACCCVCFSVGFFICKMLIMTTFAPFLPNVCHLCA